MRLKLLVIADDLTGGNATGVLLRKQGWNVYTVPDFQADVFPTLETSEAVVWNSASRLLSHQQAKERVQKMLSTIIKKHSVQGIVLGKRIDSTLRGPLGAEIEGILSVLPSDVVAVVVPSFPASGRITKGRNLFVHGIPVHQTEAGSDPFSPIQTADVLELIKAQTSLSVSWIETAKYSQDELQEIVKRESKKSRIVICDAVSDEEISLLAEVWAQVHIPILPVDPGPFTACYATAKKSKYKHILVVSGSLAPTTRQQLDMLEKHILMSMIQIDLAKLCDSNLSVDYMKWIHGKISEELERYQVIGLRTDTHFSQLAGGDSSQVIADVVLQLITHYPFSGMYLSGGEVSFAILSKMQVKSLQLLKEIVPLCAMVRVVGGSYDGMRIVTKGGSVGDTMSIIKSVEALLKVV